jgi:hypothetical protein
MKSEYKNYLTTEEKEASTFGASQLYFSVTIY